MFGKGISNIQQLLLYSFVPYGPSLYFNLKQNVFQVQVFFKCFVKVCYVVIDTPKTF